MASEEMIDLETGADEVDDAMAVDEDHTTRVKGQATKRKGRGFNDRGGHDRDFHKDDFEALDESESTGRAQRSVEGWIVLITGVHEEATEEDVKEKLADFGEVKNFHMNLDRRTGFVKGYALVEYLTSKEAKNAIDALNGTELLGKKIGADFAFVRGPGGSRSVQHVGKRSIRGGRGGGGGGGGGSRRR
ncbi:putative polyadenylate-binding protein [Cladochytrium replicatum]|nr:putative polyadenylate-binding protein [Cladochytrium replicatum]